MSEDSSFGRKVLRLAPRAILEVETEASKDSFNSVDGLVASIVKESLEGKQVIEVSRRNRADKLESLYVPNQFKKFLEDSFTVSRQEERGAWYLPKETSIKGGFINLPYLFEQHSGFALNIAWEQNAKVPLESKPEAVLCWAILSPLMEDLLRPLIIRTDPGPTKPKEKQKEQWAMVDSFVKTTQLPLDAAIRPLRLGSGWSKLRRDERQQLMFAYVKELRRVFNLEAVQAYRAARTQKLTETFYQKVQDGTATRRRVLNQELARTLSGYFNGDWLEFLQYIEERPDPNEEIVTSLPKTKLYTRGTNRIQEIAAKKDLPAAEVEKMLSAYWKESGGLSPVERRIATLKNYWREFEDLHQRQQLGDISLWGLVGERFTNFMTEGDAASPHHSGLFRDLLSVKLQEDIHELWGTTVLLRWPDKIISEPYPHAAMAEALGPALKFWHGVSLTAWFLCEGPYSRTDMEGLEKYHERELEALKKAEGPVDSRLFRDLIAAEKKLPKAEPMYDAVSETDVAPGITVTMSVGGGSKRQGFVRLRDIITQYRRNWTKQYLDKYLDGRWESPLRDTAREYSRLSVDKGRPPTVRQFARYALPVTNQWFGGDLSAFYGAIGQKSPLRPAKNILLPQDRLGFAWTVLNLLGGIDEEHRNYDNIWFAEKAFWYVQLKEGKGGEPPTLKEFGESAFKHQSDALDKDPNVAYSAFISRVEEALANPVSSSPSKLSLAQQQTDHNRPQPKSSWLKRFLGG